MLSIVIRVSGKRRRSHGHRTGWKLVLSDFCPTCMWWVVSYIGLPNVHVIYLFFQSDHCKSVYILHHCYYHTDLS